MLFVPLIKVTIVIKSTSTTSSHLINRSNEFSLNMN